jgi:hypothetical protein
MPAVYAASYDTTEAVPLQNRIYATMSKAVILFIHVVQDPDIAGRLRQWQRKATVGQ